MNQDLLEGTVYLDETFVPRLESRNEERQGSKKKRGISDQKINICCTIDQTGKINLQVNACGRIKSENLIHVFQGKFKEGSDLVFDSQ